MPPPEKGGGKEKNMVANLLSAAGTAVTVAIAVAAVGIVVLTEVLHFVRKKKGKTGCGCDCSGCAGCSACHTDAQKKDK